MLTFSIIIPVFNSAGQLRSCLASLLVQTCGDWEALCVDDGSSDASPEILEEAARGDSRIRVLHKPNGGVASARNLALEHAQGKWVCFLDADDLLVPEALRLLSDALVRFPASDVVCFGTRFVPHDAESAGGEASDGVRIADVSARLPDLLLEWGLLTRVYRRELLSGIRFAPYCVGEDLVFMISAMMRARHAALVSAALYGYRRHAESGRRAGGGRGVRFVRDYMSFSREALALLTASDRPVGANAIAHYLRCATRRVLRELRRLPRRDAGPLWDAWRKMVVELAELPRLPFWARLRMRAAGAVRSNAFARVLYLV